EHLSKLKRLIIDNNQIEEIKELSKLKQLEELDIRRNNIQIKGYYKIFENYKMGTKDNEIKKILEVDNLSKLDYFNYNYNQFEMSKGVMSIQPDDEIEDDFLGPW
ncbi:MAG: leucine-rich repeat domain-containing protein, partial [Candidatus Hodarchaeota archaeon]